MVLSRPPRARMGQDVRRSSQGNGFTGGVEDRDLVSRDPRRPRIHERGWGRETRTRCRSISALRWCQPNTVPQGIQFHVCLTTAADLWERLMEYLCVPTEQKRHILDTARRFVEDE